MADKAKDNTDADEWLRKHEKTLPPEEIQPSRAVSLDGAVGRSNHELITDGEPSPTAARYSKGDIPRGTEYIPELGILHETPTEMSTPASVEHVTEWGTLAWQVVNRLLPLLSSIDSYVALSDEAEKRRWIVGKLPALAELRAFHRTLSPEPDWRRLLLLHFHDVALKRAEQREREAQSRAGNPPQRELYLHIRSAREILDDMIRSIGAIASYDRRSLMSKVPQAVESARIQFRLPEGTVEMNRYYLPAGLTVEVIEALLAGLRYGAGGRGGGWTPEKAVELAELAVHDMAKFREEIENRHAAKMRRSKKSTTR